MWVMKRGWPDKPDEHGCFIEYILNSVSEHSFQEFRLIDNVNSDNKSELDFFMELDSVKLPVVN